MPVPILAPRTLELEDCTVDDVMFTATTIYEVASKINQHPQYVIEHVPVEELVRYTKVADVTHEYPPFVYIKDFIDRYQLEEGSFKLEDTWHEEHKMPSSRYFGEIYGRIVAYLVKVDNYSLIEAYKLIFLSYFTTDLIDFRMSYYYEPEENLYELLKNGKFCKED